MRWKKETGKRSTTGLIGGVYGAALACTLALAAISATAQDEKCTSAKCGDKFQAESTTQTLYLKNIAQQNDANEILTALRNMLSPHSKIFLVPSQNAIVMNAPPEQLALAQKLIHDLDRPKKSYRLVYTVYDLDHGKRVGSEHVSLVATSGSRTQFKGGNKVPVITGSYNVDTEHQTSQATYLDVGMNFDVTPYESANGVLLRTRVERSSVSTEKSGIGPQDPIIRQAMMDMTTMVAEGKPTTLGTLEMRGDGEHPREVEVTLTALP